MAGRRSKEFDQAKAIRLYRAGKGWREIGRELGVHPYSVQWFFNSMGFEANPRIKWDLEKAKKMRKEGFTFREIAEEVGVSFAAVRQALEKDNKNEENQI